MVMIWLLLAHKLILGRAFREAGEQDGQMGSNDRDLQAAGKA